MKLLHPPVASQQELTLIDTRPKWWRRLTGAADYSGTFPGLTTYPKIFITLEGEDRMLPIGVKIPEIRLSGYMLIGVIPLQLIDGDTIECSLDFFERDE